MINAHNSDIALDFYNDKIKEVIAADIIAEPFTYIPITAGHMELVGGNAVVFGKIKEGYDVIDLTVDAETSYEDKSGEASRTDFLVGYAQTDKRMVYYNYSDVFPYGPYETEYDFWTPDNGASYRVLKGAIVITLAGPYREGSYYYIYIRNDIEDINIVAQYQVQAGDTYVEVKAGLEADLLTEGVAAADIEVWPIPNQIALYGDRETREFRDTPTVEVGDISSAYTNFTVQAYNLDLGLTSKFAQLKVGSTHAYGFVYKDRGGRTCSVIKNDDLSVYIPFYAEEVTNLLESIVKLKFKIFHKPPVWAESYEIVYFGNMSMDFFLQIRAEAITQLAYGSHRYSLNIQNTIDDTRLQNNRWKVSDYSWEDGDRMRIIGRIDDGTGDVEVLYSGEAIGAGFSTSPYDYEIESTGTQYGDGEAVGGEWLIFQALDHPEPFEGETNILFEVYRPKKGMSKTTPYGTGMVFEIGIDDYGNKYHKGDVDQVFDVNGTCTTMAEVENTANDCWKFKRLNYVHDTANIQPFWAESMYPSDWWSGQIAANRLTSQGFPFLEDLSQKQTVLNCRGRHGGFMITGTRTNNIAHFTYDDFFDLPEKNGMITGLREVGYTLKVIQQYKETSIYINRIQTFNPDGTEQFTLTDKFLAEQRPMEDDYGCQNPESIMVNGRHLYYWDQSQGKFIRSAPNGQVVLDIKMKRHFKDIVKWIQSSGGASMLNVFTGANNEHDEIWLTFRMRDEVKGVVFSEKKGRYITRLNQPTESYVHLGNFFAHLYQQSVWVMNIDEGQDYLSWVGLPTIAEIEVVSNMEPVRNKVYNAVALFADHELDSLPKYVYIPQQASGSNELMESNIPIWDRREGVFFGEIMKDENSKGNFLSVYDRKLNGRTMRGRHCYVKLMTDEHTEKVRVDSIVIFSTLSERNV